MRFDMFRVGRFALLMSSLLVVAQGAAFGQGAGQPLPELSGRSIGPGDAPRLARRIRLQRRARKRSAYRELRSRRRQRYRSVRLKAGGWRFYGAGWSAHVATDGAVVFDARAVTWSTRRMRLTFDINDAVVRRKRKNPYVSAKLRFLRETAPWRRTLRRAAKRRARRAYFLRLPSRLRTLWTRRDITTLRKRALLFELWEECLEPGRTTLSLLAQQARWLILRFIQKHLPMSSPHSFTKRELSWMSKRRRGLLRFDPYGRNKRPLLLRRMDTGR